MTKPARRLFAELDEFTPDGSELLMVEVGGVKKKITGLPQGEEWSYYWAAYTMKANECLLINSNGSDRTITLPATHVAGDWVKIHHYNTGTQASRAIVARGSSTFYFKGDPIYEDIILEDGDTLYLAAQDATAWTII